MSGGTGASEREAKVAAVGLARSLCQTSDSLQRLDSARAQLLKKAHATDAKLGSLVQTQIDETRWALQLLDNSVSLVEDVRGNLSQIANMCLQCRQMVPEYNEIRCVALARRHLRATQRLLEMFRSIPTRARELEDLISQEDSKIFHVYVEIRKLVRLRDKAFERGKEYDSDGLRERFKHHFDSLQAVSSALEKRLKEIFRDCFYLAEEDPTTLVLSLKIVEVEDRSQNFKLFNYDTTMVEMVKNILEESVAERFAKAFDGADKEGDAEASESQGSLGHVLRVGTELLEDIGLVAGHVAQCFPPRHDIFSFYESRYQKWLYTRLLHSTSDLHALSPGELLDCIRWIHDYRLRIKELGADTSASSILEQHVPLLMEAYLRRVKETLSEWVGKIMQQDWRSEPTQEENGHYSTCAPQDIFCMLDQQLDVAFKRHLRGKPFYDMAKMCTEVLKVYQDMLLQALRAQGRDQQDIYLCALLNNCQQCSDNSEALRDRCLEHLNGELCELLEDDIDDVLDGFVRVGSYCVTVLVQQMMDCIEDNILQTIFKKEWREAPDGDFADKIIVTLQDYFADFESWISSEFFFARLIKDTIRKLVSIYIDRFVQSGIDLSKQGVFGKLQSDRLMLNEFFTSENITECVPVKFIENELERIEKIQSLLDCEVGWIPLYFETVFELYGADKGQALKSLLSMRKDISSQEKTETLDRYREKYADVSSSKTFSHPQADVNPLLSPQRVAGRTGGRDKRNVLSSIWDTFNKGASKVRKGQNEQGSSHASEPSD